MKKYTFTMYHSLNIVLQLLFDTIIYKLCGTGPIIYFLLCDLIAGGLHPCAYHFISEHYLLNYKSNQETWYKL